MFCASVPQRSQRILRELISNSVFDRVVGRAQASKRTLEWFENELPGVQNEAKMAPFLGGPGAQRANFERFWMPFGRPFGTPKSLKSVLKLNLKFSSNSERHFGPLGVVLGSMLSSCGSRLRLCFAVRRPNTKTLIFDDPLTRKRVFSGPWGSQKQPKISPESLLAPTLAPKASWRPLGLDF